jgi:serine/threonine protein kinase
VVGREARVREHGLLDGRYRLGALLGSGAMGQVWEAVDERLDRRVALKQVLVHSLDSQGVARMHREAQVAARLHHPNVVTVFDLVVDDGRPFLVMELVRGQSLAERLAQGGPLEPWVAAHIGGGVAAALAAAERAGIVHRDVKPANVLLGDDGSVKLADFGIARGVRDPAFTEVGSMLGSVSFMAPELARGGPATAASDVWSLGATLYASVVGHAPHAWGPDATQVTVLGRLMSDRVVVPRELGALGPLLTAMLDTDPARRPTAAEAGPALAALGQDRAPTGPIQERPRPSPGTYLLPPPEPVRRRSPAVLVVGGLVLVGAAALAGWLLLGRGTSSHVAGATTPTAVTSTAPAPSTPPAPTTPRPTTPRSTTTPARTTSAAPTTTPGPAVTGAGPQGFAEAGARCNAKDPAVFAGFTAESRIVVCRTADNRYYYKGLRTTDGSGIELDDPAPTATGFTARNGATTYELGADGVTITGPSGVLSVQPWIERTAP